jgi:hypothetical protein
MPAERFDVAGLEDLPAEEKDDVLVERALQLCKRLDVGRFDQVRKLGAKDFGAQMRRGLSQAEAGSMYHHGLARGSCLR